MNGTVDITVQWLRASLLRAAGFFVVWLIIAGAAPRDLPIGVVAAIAATWASLRLLPLGQWRVGAVAVILLALRFLYQSIRAGVDVALRALDPRLPIQPGFVVFDPQLPAGSKRDAFCTMTSLLPGTLPVGFEIEGVVFHCLDVTQPVTKQLAVDRAFFTRAFGGEGSDV